MNEVDSLLNDIKNTLEDAIECEDWKCVEEVLEMIQEYQGDFDCEDEEYTDE